MVNWEKEAPGLNFARQKEKSQNEKRVFEEKKRKMVRRSARLSKTAQISDAPTRSESEVEDWVSFEFWL